MSNPTCPRCRADLLGTRIDSIADAQRLGDYSNRDHNCGKANPAPLAEGLRYRVTNHKSEAPKPRTVDEIGDAYGMDEEGMDKLEDALRSHFSNPGAPPMKVRGTMIALGPAGSGEASR